MKTHLLIFFALLCLHSTGQINLVPNPGFEEYVVCPTNLHGVFYNLVYDWECPTDGTSDYYNVCAALNSRVNVPDNFIGNRTAHSGNAYAGILVYSRTNVVPDDYVEYIQARLLQKMEKDYYYCVTFYVSTIVGYSHLWQSYTSDAISASFTQYPEDYHGNAQLHDWKLFNGSRVNNPAGRYIMPADGWVKVSGIYKAHGDELYITIGNFTPVDSTPLLQLNTSAAIDKGAYFFIDDISVVKVEDMKDTIICRADLPAIELVPDTAVSGYIWNTGETTPVITPVDSGWYWVEYDPGCALLRDSAHVGVIELPHVSLPQDTFICAGNVLQLATSSTGGEVDNYNWSYGATTPVVNIDQGGPFMVTATNICGKSADTINIDLWDKPQISLPASIDLCVDEQVSPITITSGLPLDNYLWSTNETTPAITIYTPGGYWLSSQNECGTTQRYFEAVDCPLPFASVFIPNVFSPNGDGNNDVWLVYGDSIRVTSIALYNRWGEKVFETDSNTGWDGTYNGVLQPAGVYVYYIKCSDLLTTEPRHYKGSLTLVR